MSVTFRHLYNVMLEFPPLPVILGVLDRNILLLFTHRLRHLAGTASKSSPCGDWVVENESGRRDYLNSCTALVTAFPFVKGTQSPRQHWRLRVRHFVRQRHSLSFMRSQAYKFGGLISSKSASSLYYSFATTTTTTNYTSINYTTAHQLF